MEENRLQTLDRARLALIERLRTERREVLRSAASLYAATAVFYCMGAFTFDVWIPLETLTAFQLGVWLGCLLAMIAVLPVILVLFWSDWRFFQEMYGIRHGDSLQGKSPLSAWLTQFSAYHRDCRA